MEREKETRWESFYGGVLVGGLLGVVGTFLYFAWLEEKEEQAEIERINFATPEPEKRSYYSTD